MDIDALDQFLMDRKHLAQSSGCGMTIAIVAGVLLILILCYKLYRGKLEKKAEEKE